MFQMDVIQSVASLLVHVVKEATGWVEDMRDSAPSSVFEQLEQGLVVKFRNGIPRSLVTVYGEWQIIGRYTLQHNELIQAHERVLSLMSLDLNRQHGPQESYLIRRFGTQRIPNTVYREIRLTSLQAWKLWEKDLRRYLALFPNEIEGHEVFVKKNGVGDRISPKQGKRFIVTELTPNGIATLRDRETGVESQVPVTSLMLFRDGLLL